MRYINSIIHVDDIMEPGDLLRLLMNKNDDLKTIPALSSASSVPHGTIWNILNNNMHPRYKTAQDLGNALNYPATLLYAGILDQQYIG